jgi:hypothetical protein
LWRREHRLSAAALLAAFVVAPSAAHADPTAARLVGAYSAPAECPNHAAWRAALHAGVGAELASTADGLAIEIQRLEGDAIPTYEGRVGHGEAESSSDERHVRGTSCREVFEALTLIARLGAVRRSSAPAAAAKAPSAAPPAWTLTAEEELELARDPPPEVLGRAPETKPLRLAAAALALWGGAARATFDADIGLALSARWIDEAWQPLFLVGAYGGREHFGVSGTSAGARLERLALHVAACPLRFPREAAFGVRPCLDLDAGVLRGSGVSVERARGHTAPWLSTGMQLRAEWSPWGPLELGAMVGGVLALSRPRFYFEPDTTAFAADALAIRAGASAGMSF